MSILWLWISNRIDSLYALENQLTDQFGTYQIALYGSLLCTLLLLSARTWELRRPALSAPAALLRALLVCSWMFPFAYCLLLGAPLWMTLGSTTGTWIAGRLILSAAPRPRPAPNSSDR